jgi:aldose 1-epimerase
MESIVITDAACGSSARIAAHLGFNCYEFQSAAPGGSVVDVIDCQPGFIDGKQRPNCNGTPLLFPYPNRIREGRFHWDGLDYQLPAGKVVYEGSHAIHGFCFDRPWRVIQRSAESATGEFQLSVDAPDRLEFWPADFIIRVRYKVSGAALICEVGITNPDTKLLPWGFGTHAYFKLPLGPHGKLTQCLIEAPAHQQWELVDCLPTGQRQKVSGPADLRAGAAYELSNLDDVLSGLRPQLDALIETSISDHGAGLKVVQRFGQEFRELVVFKPPWTTAVCLEPYTCVTDAINLQQKGIDAGLRVLEPAASFHTSIEISTERLTVPHQPES